MPPQWLGWAGLMIAAAAAVGIFLTRDWRLHLGLMAAQYLGAAGLAAVHWPVGMATSLLVAGWMSLAAVGMTLTGNPAEREPSQEYLLQGRAFRVFMVGIVVVLAAGVAPRGDDVFPGIGVPAMAGSVMLAGLGLLELGTTSRVESIIFGLFTVLTGFEVLYSAVEGSILVAGMLAAATLGLGLAGAYLLNSHAPEEIL